MDLSLDEFYSIIKQCYENTFDNDLGAVADYIPQLAHVNPDLYGVSFCDCSGTVYSLGDTVESFCLQSASKPLSYCFAREQEKIPGNPIVHEHVGYEPSGRAFNEFVLNRDGLPHNPLINAGAIMVSSLIKPDCEPAERFESIQKFFQKMGGRGSGCGFDNSVYLSEKRHADRNISLAYYMRENGAFEGYPTASEIDEHLDLYFQSCSITTNCHMGSVIAATLANSGVCPVTKETVIEPLITKDALSIMYTCGMYDFSGQFSFQIGLPAKSGVSGCVLLCIPNVGGFCIWSPRLDQMGNSVRGVQFCEEFTRLTSSRFHLFHRTVATLSTNANASSKKVATDVYVSRLIFSATTADDKEFIDLVTEIATTLKSEGETLEEAKKRLVSTGDYDKRTPLHLAAAEGKFGIVEYILRLGCPANPKDRWGNTPSFEAKKTLMMWHEREREREEDSGRNDVSEEIMQITATYMQILDMLELANIGASSIPGSSEHGFSRLQKRSDSDLASIMEGIQLDMPIEPPRPPIAHVISADGSPAKSRHSPV